MARIDAPPFEGASSGGGTDFFDQHLRKLLTPPSFVSAPHGGIAEVRASAAYGAKCQPGTTDQTHSELSTLASDGRPAPESQVSSSGDPPATSLPPVTAGAAPVAAPVAAPETVPVVAPVATHAERLHGHQHLNNGAQHQAPACAQPNTRDDMCAKGLYGDVYRHDDGIPATAGASTPWRPSNSGQPYGSAMHQEFPLDAYHQRGHAAHIMQPQAQSYAIDGDAVICTPMSALTGICGVHGAAGKIRCCRCKKGAQSYFDHTCPSCQSLVCVTCLDDFRMILKSFRCPRCGEEHANQEILQNEVWKIDAFRSAERAFNSVLNMLVPGSTCRNVPVANGPHETFVHSSSAPAGPTMRQSSPRVYARTADEYHPTQQRIADVASRHIAPATMHPPPQAPTQQCTPHQGFRQAGLQTPQGFALPPGQGGAHEEPEFAEPEYKTRIPVGWLQGLSPEVLERWRGGGAQAPGSQGHVDPSADFQNARRAQGHVDPSAEFQNARRAQGHVDPYAEFQNGRRAQGHADPSADFQNARCAQGHIDPSADFQNARLAQGHVDPSAGFQNARLAQGLADPSADFQNAGRAQVSAPNSNPQCPGRAPNGRQSMPAPGRRSAGGTPNGVFETRVPAHPH